MHHIAHQNKMCDYVNTYTQTPKLQNNQPIHPLVYNYMINNFENVKRHLLRGWIMGKNRVNMCMTCPGSRLKQVLPYILQ